MFTPVEKLQVEKIVVGLRHLGMAMPELGPLLKQTLPPTGIKRAAELINTAGAELEKTLTFLLGGNNQFAANEPGPATREDAKRQAWNFLDRAITKIQEVRGMRDLGRVATVWPAQALLPLQAIEREHPYEDPYPLGKEDPRIIGPHGDYRLAHWFTWRASHYARETMSWALAAYPTPAISYEVMFSKSPVLMRLLDWGMARFADIDTQDEERTMRAQLEANPHGPFGVQFWLLLRYFNFATRGTFGGNHGIPGRYHEIQEALSSVVGHVMTQAQSDALEKNTDSWKNQNDGLWFSGFDFPGADLVNNPMGAAAALPSQKISLTLEAVHTMDAKTTVTATAKVSQRTETATLEIPDVIVEVVKEVQVPVPTLPDSFEVVLGEESAEYAKTVNPLA